MIIYIVAGAVPLLIILFIISTYNKLNTRRNQIENAKSSLDALFIKRSDLIPNLVAVAKQYTNYESSTLERIVQARNSRIPLEYNTEGELTQEIKNMMIQVENYPALRASEQFTNLQYSWNEAEEQISAGRRYLSASITDYNNGLSTFPGNVVGKTFGFSRHEWDRATETQRQNVDATQLFGNR